MRKQHVRTAIGALLLLGIAGACSSDTGDLEGRVEALEALQVTVSEDVAAVHDQIMHANMLASLDVPDNAGLHEINEAVLAGEELPSGVGGDVRSALRAVAAAQWPDSLAADAQDLQDKLQAFLGALGGDNPDHQADTATAAHNAWHPFSADAWTFLATSSGLRDEGEADEHDEHAADGQMDMEGEMNMEGEPTEEHAE